MQPHRVVARGLPRRQHLAALGGGALQLLRPRHQRRPQPRHRRRLQLRQLALQRLQLLPEHLLASLQAVQRLCVCVCVCVC